MSINGLAADLHEFSDSDCSEPRWAHGSHPTGVVMRGFLYPTDLRPEVVHFRFAQLVDQALNDYWYWAAGGPTAWAHGTRVSTFTIHVQPHALSSGPIGVHIWLSRAGQSQATFGFRVVSSDMTVEHAAGEQVVEAVFSHGKQLSITDEQWRLIEPLMLEDDDDTLATCFPQGA